MVSIENLTFSYGAKADCGMKDINLNIKQGECVLLCGRSGCGKTTITKLINGLIPNFTIGKKEGIVWINGKNVDDISMFELSKEVACVFQNPKSQFFNLDTESEIVFSMENQGIPIGIIDKRLEQTIDELGIRALLEKNMFQMSGGEKQIIAFACAYATDPDIFVLDEPSANLDLGTMKMIGLILGKLKARGKTIIIAEHRIAYLQDIVDHVYYIENGKIEETYSGREFYLLEEEQRKKLGLRQLRENHSLAVGKYDVTCEKTECHTLKVEDLHLAYGGKTVIEHIDFELHSGEIVALVGDNGTGKTTLSRCICGLHKQKSGKIYWNGIEVKQKLRLMQSYIVMQDVNHQLFSESVEEECFLGNEGLEKDKVHELLKELDLYNEIEMHPQSLSGGQKQRLAIATAILAQKKVLIFDEPTSGLDYGNMIRVSSMIQGLSQKGYIILIITHDMEFIENACNRCIYLQKKQATEITEGLAAYMAME